ncbi:hypothetical protein TNCV_1690991 [Trichonephila clavipes]|nr:hypothetical protein TNCV_1690991 [Trichonephila clavipes]
MGKRIMPEKFLKWNKEFVWKDTEEFPRRPNGVKTSEMEMALLTTTNDWIARRIRCINLINFLVYTMYNDRIRYYFWFRFIFFKLRADVN